MKKPAFDLLFQRIKSAMMFPVSIEFIIVDTKGASETFRETIYELATAYRYSVVPILFNYTDFDEYGKQSQIDRRTVRRRYRGLHIFGHIPTPTLGKIIGNWMLIDGGCVICCRLVSVSLSPDGKSYVKSVSPQQTTMVAGRISPKKYAKPESRKPFAILKVAYRSGEETVFLREKETKWTNETMFNLLNEDGCHRYNFDKEEDVASCIEQFKRYTMEEHYEGVVLKPNQLNIWKVSPYMKVRNPDYLTIFTGTIT